MQKKILLVYGTRPEFIKLYPLYQLIRQTKGWKVDFLSTGQHKQLLTNLYQVYDFEPQFDFKVFLKNQSLGQMSQKLILKLTDFFHKKKYDWVMVQGDTSTAFCAALAAFYHHLPVAHVEAGLRTYQSESPFPEEINRQMISRIAKLHFAPTSKAVQNLKLEKIDPDKIYLTGNTIVDAVRLAQTQLGTLRFPKLDRILAQARRSILITTHRRENFESGLDQIFKALIELLKIHPDIQFIFPVHLNPYVQAKVNKYLKKLKRGVQLLGPVDYFQMLYLLQKSYMVLTDSGGLQEEAPCFGKPVLVLRQNTERMEAVIAGTAKLVGTDQSKIIQETHRLLTMPNVYEQMSHAPNPFGDGKAAEKILAILNKVGV